jgi:hypothetical protein
VHVLLRVLWHVKADSPDADGAADGEQNRANTYMKIVRVLKKVFGDCWLVPDMLTVEQMYTYINKKGGYSKPGGRWHDRGAHVEGLPKVADWCVCAFSCVEFSCRCHISVSACRTLRPAGG